MSLAQGSYLSAFGMLSADFLRLTEYVEPIDDNLKTFSHRLYELLLRTCTEFESVCKDMLVDKGSTTAPDAMNINDYKKLEADLQLEFQEVGIRIWRPQTTFVKPFKEWSTTSLTWYKAYNEVKHSRNVKFSQANLKNVRDAMAGLFALLTKTGVIEKGTGYQELSVKMGKVRECVYPGHFFSLLTSV